MLRWRPWQLALAALAVVPVLALDNSTSLSSNLDVVGRMSDSRTAVVINVLAIVVAVLTFCFSFTFMFSRGRMSPTYDNSRIVALINQFASKHHFTSH